MKEITIHTMKPHTATPKIGLTNESAQKVLPILWGITTPSIGPTIPAYENIYS